MTATLAFAAGTGFGIIAMVALILFVTRGPGSPDWNDND